MADTEHLDFRMGAGAPMESLDKAMTDAEALALRHLQKQQKPKGDFEGEMVWCSMILSQAIIVRTIVGKPFPSSDRHQFLQHFKSTQAADGSWGMHPESPGYVFFTTLAYVALRLSGVSAKDPMAAAALAWIKRQPTGVKGIPTWGKFWLAILDLYPYRGLNAIPPELFLLPEWLPFHPRRYYCHTRLIYLGLAYLSGQRFTAALDQDLIRTLRQELYDEPYCEIPFENYRHHLAQGDVHVPISGLLKRIYDGLAWFEQRPFKRLRSIALRRCFNRILFEQKSTQYQGISPVNGLLNTLSLFAHDQNHPELEASLQGVEAWRWEDLEEGLRYVGARSNTWDTAFILQALCEIDAPDPATLTVMTKAHDYMDSAQIKEEITDYSTYWRDPALGGWCFSDGEHRWPVSDCTAEALSALVLLYRHPAAESIQALKGERLRHAARFILSRQNRDGGFGTYERRRAGKLLEVINPSEMFGQCMTELSYIECTASSLAALLHFQAHDPDFAPEMIHNACKKAVDRLLSLQQADGSWQGFWGINYTYACFHVVRALRLAGVPRESASLQKTKMFLKSIQKSDGGWGEHYSSCLIGHYVEHPQSQVVMTSWALMTLLELEDPADVSIQRGYLWLLSQQLPEGTWPRQAVNGVFFGAAMLDYRLYHLYFPVWAITRYNRAVTKVLCCTPATNVAKST